MTKNPNKKPSVLEEYPGLRGGAGSTGPELLASGVVGLWADYEDIVDSVAFTRAFKRPDVESSDFYRAQYRELGNLKGKENPVEGSDKAGDESKAGSAV